MRFRQYHPKQRGKQLVSFFMQLTALLLLLKQFQNGIKKVVDDHEDIDMDAYNLSKPTYAKVTTYCNIYAFKYYFYVTSAKVPLKITNACMVATLG